ncbi:cbb3-type cytochrome oxidase assembly protein CcoS [candidate division GN15 bacterium]|uniref:Cbb3-type cytochrome oxidase assembly protein CcoS n=1 Tax=candidate division GN15 bacterium TaxID=2072418 RepID=A0A855X1S9_9BACT|nr:MAG: cbb3-type cytochrome oxidase assembly protein CcoS [candidate division GN15 bacterium]
MYVLVVLMGASLLVAGGFLLAYRWAVRHGQYDDLYTPSVRMLFDDDSPQVSEKRDDNKSASEN